MSDSVLDVKEIAAVLGAVRSYPGNTLRHRQAAAIVTWLDERVLHVGWYDPVYEGWVVKSSPDEYVYVVRPESPA